MISTVTPHRREDGVDERVTVGSLAQSGRADRDDVDRSVTARLLGHHGDGVRGPVHRGLRQLPGLVEPLTQSGDHGAVDQDVELAVASRGEMELHRVGADVDDREPRGFPADQRLQATGDTGVAPPGEPQPAYGLVHQGGVRGLHGDGVHGRAVDGELGELDETAVHGRTSAQLVHPREAQVVPWSDELVLELLLGVGAATQGREGSAQCREHRRQGCDVEGEGSLHRRHPQLQPAAVDVPLDLGVHQPVPDLDRPVTVQGQHVRLVALVHLTLAERCQRLTGVIEIAERAPLPPRYDGRCRRVGLWVARRHRSSGPGWVSSGGCPGASRAERCAATAR